MARRRKAQHFIIRTCPVIAQILLRVFSVTPCANARMHFAGYMFGKQCKLLATSSFVSASRVSPPLRRTRSLVSIGPWAWASYAALKLHSAHGLSFSIKLIWPIVVRNRGDLAWQCNRVKEIYRIMERCKLLREKKNAKQAEYLKKPGDTSLI